MTDSEYTKALEQQRTRIEELKVRIERLGNGEPQKSTVSEDQLIFETLFNRTFGQSKNPDSFTLSQEEEDMVTLMLELAHGGKIESKLTKTEESLVTKMLEKVGKGGVANERK